MKQWKMKRRFLSLLLVLSLVLGLSACSDGDSDKDKDNNNDVQGEEAVIGINPEWAETTVFYEIFVRSFADGRPVCPARTQ